MYLPSDAVPQERGARYLLTVRAAHHTLTGDHVFSHESALVLLGLPSLQPWPDAGASASASADQVAGRSSTSSATASGSSRCEPVLIDGMLVTSAGPDGVRHRPDPSVRGRGGRRGRGLPPVPGGPGRVRALVEAYGRRRGFQKAVAVLRFADERSGSVGESWSRVEMDRLGFVPPLLQFEVITDGLLGVGRLRLAGGARPRGVRRRGEVPGRAVPRAAARSWTW